MEEWNVVITCRPHAFEEVCRRMREYGTVRRTDYFNVLTLAVDEPSTFLESLRIRIDKEPEFLAMLGHVVPVTKRFRFQSRESFETQAREAVESWVTVLAGKRFHVRMTRRGFKHRISSQEEEQWLDQVLIQRILKSATDSAIDFHDPDYILAIQTVGQWAGLSLWSREDLKRYPFLGLD